VLRCDIFVKRCLTNEEKSIVARQISEFIDRYVGGDFVWFYLKPLISSSDLASKDGEQYTVFELKLNYKDCCEDAWTLVSCLYDMENKVGLDNSKKLELSESVAMHVTHAPKFGSNIAIRISDSELILSENNRYPPRWVDACSDIDKRLWLMDGTFGLISPSLCKVTDDMLSLLLKGHGVTTINPEKIILKGQKNIMEKINRTNELFKASMYCPLSSVMISQDMRIIGRGSLKLPAFIPEGLKDSLPPIGVLIDICIESLAFNDIIDGRYSFCPPFSDGKIIAEVPACECVIFNLSKLHWAKLESSKHRLPISYSSTRWQVPASWSNPLKAGRAEGLEGAELRAVAKQRESYLNSIILGGTICYLYEVYEQRFKDKKVSIEYLSTAEDHSLTSFMPKGSIDENSFKWQIEGLRQVQRFSVKSDLAKPLVERDEVRNFVWALHVQPFAHRSSRQIFPFLVTRFKGQDLEDANRLARRIVAECQTCNLYRPCAKDGKGYPIGRRCCSPTSGGKFINERLFGELQIDHFEWRARASENSEEAVTKETYLMIINTALLWMTVAYCHKGEFGVK